MLRYIALLILTTFSLLTFTAKAKALKVATWNIAWLGSGEYNERQQSDYLALAKYATKLNADIVALQEVENADYARKVLGDEYDYYFSSRDWIQRVGVAVKKSSGLTVKAQEYRDLDMGKTRYGMDLTLSKNGKDLRLLAVHLKSGCFTHKLDKISVKKIKLRSRKDKYKKIACATLSNQTWPLERWIDHRAQESTPYIVLGDFNRRFAEDIRNNYSETQGFWQAIDDDGYEALWSPTLENDSKCWGGYYKDYIDHIVLDPRAKANMVAGSFEQIVFKGQYTKKLANALSDHCPISVKITL